MTPAPAEWQAARKWFNSLSAAEMLAVRKHIPKKTMAAITAYWLAHVKR